MGQLLVSGTFSLTYTATFGLDNVVGQTRNGSVVPVDGNQFGATAVTPSNHREALARRGPGLGSRVCFIKSEQRVKGGLSEAL